MARTPGTVRIDLESVAFALIMFVIGAAAVSGGGMVTAWAVSAGAGGPSLAAGAIAMLVGTPMALLGFRRWRLGPKHVLVEPAAGKIELVLGDKRSSCALAELKATVEKYAHRNAYGRHLQDRIASPRRGSTSTSSRRIHHWLSQYCVSAVHPRRDTASERTASQICARPQELARVTR